MVLLCGFGGLGEILMGYEGFGFGGGVEFGVWSLGLS